MVKRLKDRYRVGQQAGRTELSIGEFAAIHGLSSHTIRRLRRLAREYTPSEFEELCALRRPGGLPLHVGHLPYLLVVSDKAEREKLQRRVAREGWSAPRLAAEIPGKYRRSTGGHGRPMKKPKTPAEGLRQVAEEAGRLRRRTKMVIELVQGCSGRKLAKRAEETITASVALRRELRLLEKELRSLVTG